MRTTCLPRLPPWLGVAVATSLLGGLVTPAAAQGTAPLVRNLATVVHADKARGLSAAARTALSRDGSVVVAGSEKHFFALYDRNLYQGIPHFVALDPLLHLFHAKFDEILAAVELERALPALRSFTQKQTARALTLLPARGGPIPADAEAAKWLAVYHAVPLALLPGSPAIDPRIAPEVEQQVRFIRATSGDGRTPLCPHGLSYSRFKPRGHYQTSLPLQGYFRAITFYAECSFDLNRPAELVRAVDIARLMQAADPAERDLLTQISSLLRVIAGPPDDLDGAATVALLGGDLPPLPQLLIGERLTHLTERLAAKLPAAGSHGSREHMFRLLAPGALPDNVLLQHSARGDSLPPSTLDVLAALGSQAARALRQPKLANPGVLSAAPELLVLPTTPRSFYARWLALLAQVLQVSASEHQPAFMQAPAWQERLVRSAAGSYAELRHDTLLYVKQPLIMAEGGHSVELPASHAAGYVEPRPDVFRQLQKLVQDATALLSPAPTTPLCQRNLKSAKELTELLEFLITVSELELADQPIPPALDERLRDIGSELEVLTRGHADHLPDQALIADILTVRGEGGDERALHIGIGDVDELWVIVRRAGKLILTRGGVFSYYEFLGAPGERLDDLTWQQRLESSSPPERPAWAHPLDEARVKKHAPPQLRRKQ